MKERVVYRIAPNRSLTRWAVIKEGRKALKPKASGLSKSEALDLATQLARKNAQHALVLVHKTRYILGETLRLRA